MGVGTIKSTCSSVLGLSAFFVSVGWFDFSPISPPPSPLFWKFSSSPMLPCLIPFKGSHQFSKGEWEKTSRKHRLLMLVSDFFLVPKGCRAAVRVFSIPWLLSSSQFGLSPLRRPRREGVKEETEKKNLVGLDGVGGGRFQQLRRRFNV